VALGQLARSIAERAKKESGKAHLGIVEEKETLDPQRDFSKPRRSKGITRKHHKNLSSRINKKKKCRTL